MVLKKFLLGRGTWVVLFLDFILLVLGTALDGNANDQKQDYILQSAIN